MLKFSLLFYTSLMLVGLLAVLILFYMAKAVGIVADIEGWIRGVGWPHFRIRASAVLRFELLIGSILVLFGTMVNVFLSFLYNLVSDVVGGVEITFSERE